MSEMGYALFLKIALFGGFVAGVTLRYLFSIETATSVSVSFGKGLMCDRGS
jgi:hypothetical protein